MLAMIESARESRHGVREIPRWPCRPRRVHDRCGNGQRGRRPDAAWALRRYSSPSDSMSARSLRRPLARLLRMNAARPMNGTRTSAKKSSTRSLHASSNVTPLMPVRISMRQGGSPNWATVSGRVRSDSRIGSEASGAPKAASAKILDHALWLTRRRRAQRRNNDGQRLARVSRERPTRTRPKFLAQRDEKRESFGNVTGDATVAGIHTPQRDHTNRHATAICRHWRNLRVWRASQQGAVQSRYELVVLRVRRFTRSYRNACPS